MSPTDAAALLDLPADATAEQIETRFLELRRKLEDKIAKAPTPGLQAKYRESLEEITTAFETLTLASDSSSLPVTRKQGTGNKEPGASDSAAGSPLAGGPAAASPRSRLPAPSSTRKSGREFLLVALIAVVLLAGGGWWVMQTRAESAEKTRIAAEAKVEADRRAEESKLADQQEKDRLAAEAKAEQVRVAAIAAAEKERLEKLTAQVRVGLAEAKLRWEQIEREERNAERTLSDLKSEERSVRDLPEGRRREMSLRLEAQATFSQWLSGFMVSHPARRAQVRTEELLNARQVDDAVATLSEFTAALDSIPKEISDRKPTEADFRSSVSIESTPSGLPWELVDAFGQNHIGTTPAVAKNVAVGSAQLTLNRPGWASRREAVTVKAREETRFTTTYRSELVTITSSPTGASVFRHDQPIGVTPLSLPDLPPGNHEFQLRLAGYQSTAVAGQLSGTTPLDLVAKLAPSITDADYPVVYFYRAKSIIGAGFGFRISLAGQEVGDSRNGTWLVFRVPPGSYPISLKVYGQPKVDGELKLEPNQTYFVQLKIGALKGDLKFLIQPEIVAQSAMAQLKGPSSPTLVQLVPTGSTAVDNTSSSNPRKLLAR